MIQYITPGHMSIELYILLLCNKTLPREALHMSTHCKLGVDDRPKYI